MKTSTLSSTNFTEGNILLKERTHMIKKQIKLYILGVLKEHTQTIKKKQNKVIHSRKLGN